MKIVKWTSFDHDALYSRLRNISMLTDSSAFPYKRSKITTKAMSTMDISPAQLYVLASEFEKVRNLRWAFLEHSIDILQLKCGYIEYKTDQSDDTITIMPPVIELSLEKDGSSCDILNDGMHRCFLARTCRINPTVIYIQPQGGYVEFPYYAYPLAGGWDDVKMVDKLDQLVGGLKKYHRLPAPDYKNLYRNFDSIFSNVGGPRGK